MHGGPTKTHHQYAQMSPLGRTQSGLQLRNGFTLIEMIGVIAVVSILAALIIPKVFTAIDNARINNAALSISTAKTACVNHYGKFGSFLVDGSQTPPSVLTA